MTDPDDDGLYCACVGTMVRKGWQHAETCPRWAPAPRGPGSTPEHRAAALAHIRATLTRRRQEPT